MLADKGHRTPLDVRPYFPETFDWYINTHTRLTASQSSNGFGINPIPYSEYLAYFQIYEPLSTLVNDIEILRRMNFIHVNRLNQPKGEV